MGDLFADAHDVASLRTALAAAFAHFTGEGNRRAATLLLQAMTLALTDPPRYGAFAREAVAAWVDPLTAAFERLGWDAAEAAGRATALVSGLRGVALDAFVTDAPPRTGAAADAILTALVRSPADTTGSP